MDNVYRQTPADGSMRDWLRVPASLELPQWARRQLAEPVDAERRARDGRGSAGAVFGVLDLETTGTAVASSSILEIGLVVQRGGMVLERFETFVCPDGPIPLGITRLTGISEEMVEGAPRIGTALSALDEVLQRRGVDALVAHNAPFDRSFLARAWRRSGVEHELPRFLCSLLLARRLIRAPGYGLGALVEHLSIPLHARHRALGDAEMTAVLWWELIGRARLEGVHTLEGLMGVAAPRSGRRRRPRVHTVDAPRASG